MRFMNKKLAVVVLAAGKGVRMESSLPKVVHEFNSVPMIERIIKTIKKLDPNKIITVVGYKKEIVKETITDKNIIFVEQKVQKGTGHAVLMSKSILSDFEGNIIVTPGDIPLLNSETLRELVKIHEKTNSAATVLTTIMDDPQGYGRIIRDEDGFVIKIVEHKDASEQEKMIKEINTGIFCFDCKKLFQTLPLVTSDNAQNEIYLTDVLYILRKHHKQIAAVKSDNQLEVTGINSKSQLAKLEKKVKK